MSTSRAPLRVGLIGFGTAGRFFHAPLLSSTPGLRLAAIVTSDPARRDDILATYPDVQVVAKAEELWPLELDLVVVASPNKTHVPLATAALDAGSAVVVDKPLAITSADGRALVEAAQARGRQLSVFQNRRWDGDFRTVARLVADGRLGEVQRFESRFERWRPKLKGGWRELGGRSEGSGLLYDLGSHLVDQALTLFGPAVSVYAQADVRREGAQADDDTFIALTHASGVRSHLWASATAASLGPRFRVLGSQGAYVTYGLDGQEDELRAGRTPRDEGFGVTPPERYGKLGAEGAFETCPTLDGRYTDYYAGIESALRGEGPVPVNPNDAVAALEVIEAARISADEARVVKLSEDQVVKLS
ncbi:Gfo/Idh/MocA family oxidoreductase [Actinospica sp.]|jgi:predicted dehydrogenase|uniref:Gfo/Idh/MocA family oxidoreductase n=1 Tax=Actinospica sp. TaxID=1872142 RepID=UPI002BFDBC10|nr:Gfo/Idh/MocA family oxidoreductase [Actinospica sp.]HWG22996.1 Gfo/Idh/MocA family oxidoreductase [Actinospica sp.]